MSVLLDKYKSQACMLQAMEIPSYTATAYCAIIDNKMLQDIKNPDNTETIAKWLQLAEKAEQYMAETDEARFTLYDLLDACINGSRPWTYYMDRLADPEMDDEQVLAEIVEEASRKRSVYEY